MNTKTLILDIKDNRFKLDQLKARRREILKSLNECQKSIKDQENKIYSLVGLLEKSYKEVV